MPGFIRCVAHALALFSPKMDAHIRVMRHIVDDNWQVEYPSYLSATAKVSLPTTPWPLGRALQ